MSRKIDSKRVPASSKWSMEMNCRISTILNWKTCKLLIFSLFSMLSLYLIK